jgi:hypothetical protein
VIADEMQYERGWTRMTMGVQARREAHHVRHADRIVTTSRYSAGRLMHFYGLEQAPAVIPELIDLAAWREAFRLADGAAEPGRFVVLCVCRLYARKRVDLLLRAAAELKPRIPRLQVRIAGEGPESKKLQELLGSLGLGDDVHWLGTLDREGLAREYARCDVFCLPSVQEGFGIVLLEAMAAARPIVAARAAAVPEVVPHALLVEPDRYEALAAGIETLYHQPELRRDIAAAGTPGTSGVVRAGRTLCPLVRCFHPAVLSASLDSRLCSGDRFLYRENNMTWLNVSLERRERGIALIATAASLIAIVGIAGVSVDLGRMYIAKSELMAYTDAASVAAALQLDGTAAGITRAQNAAAGMASGANAMGWDFASKPVAGGTLQFAMGFAATPNAPDPATWAANPPNPSDYRFVQVTDW